MRWINLVLSLPLVAKMVLSSYLICLQKKLLDIFLFTILNQIHLIKKPVKIINLQMRRQKPIFIKTRILIILFHIGMLTLLMQMMTLFINKIDKIFLCFLQIIHLHLLSKLFRVKLKANFHKQTKIHKSTSQYKNKHKFKIFSIQKNGLKYLLK